MVQKTTHGFLDYITLCGSLCDPNTRDSFQLRRRFAFFNFCAMYDYVLIDTPPGYGSVHELAVHASDDIILPTDMSPISLSAVERFCSDFENRPGLSAVHCSILRNSVRPSGDPMQILPYFREKVKVRIAADSLAMDERVRLVTSSCRDFLNQPLPRRIVSQLTHIAVDLLHAERSRLQNAVADLCESESPGKRQLFRARV